MEFLKKLLHQFTNNEPNAMNELVQQTQEKLFRFCLYLTKNKADAQDLFQETYLRAFEKKSTLKEDSKIQSWLMSLCHNIFIDQKRKDKLKLKLQTSKDELTQIMNERDLEVLAILKQFPEEDQIVLLLIDREEMSYSETAKILKISEAALKSRIHRLRQEFIKLWKESETFSLSHSSTK